MADINKRLSTLDIIWLPRSLLILFGVINCENSKKKSFTHAVTFCFGILLLLGAAFGTVLQFTAVLYFFLIDDISSGLLQTLPYIPYIFVNLRGLVVLFVAICYRHSWEKLSHCLDENVFASFSKPELYQKRLSEWRLICFFWAFMSLALIIIWEIADWVHFIDQDPFRKNTNFDNPLDPMPFKITMWAYEIVWTFTCTLPFFLSQQVYIIIGTFAIALAGCVKRLHEDLDITRITVKTFTERQNCTLMKKEEIKILIESVRTKFAEIEYRHNKMVVFCHDLSSIGSHILFGIFLMDVSAICGFSAALVTGSESFLSSYLLNVGSIIVFGVYATVFLLPMVSVFEQSDSIGNTAYQLLATTQPLMALDTREGNLLRHSMESFIRSCKDQIMVFNGAGLFYVTRNLLVTTWTFIVSAGIIERQLLTRTPNYTCSCAFSGINETFGGNLTSLLQPNTSKTGIERTVS